MTPADKIVLNNVKLAMGSEVFFGTLALRYPWIADESCPTMATDGTAFFYNPKFVESMTNEEVKAVAIHEIMHVALLHPMSMKGYEPRRANIAMDYAINLLIYDCGYKLPSCALLDSRYKDMSWKQIYKLLPEQKQDQGNDGSGSRSNSNNGDVRPTPGNEEQQATAKENAKVSVAQGEQKAKAMGHMPGPLRAMVVKTREPEENYQYLFQKFMSPIFATDYTWARPSRRFMGQGMYLPSVMKTGVGALVVGVDTSASVANEDLERFLGLINHFLGKVRPEVTHVLYCDTDVYKHDKLKPGKPMDLSGFVAQRGGTRFAPVFDYAQKHQLKPKAFVYLTDMECSNFGTDPGVPTIWMRVGKYQTTPPFGTVINLK